MPISEETLSHELLHAAKLSNKHRGEVAELAFMRKAATLGFAVAKPWGDTDRYDVVVRAGKLLWRVQVKSVLGNAPERPHYRLRTVNWLKMAYTADEIDFLVGYIFPEDIWYIFPASIVENRKSLFIRPGSTRSKIEIYREAWNLMRPDEVGLTAPEKAAGAAVGG